MSTDWTPERVFHYVTTGRMGQVPLPVITALQDQGLAKIARAAVAPVGGDATRSCGECRACCSALGIEESPGEQGHGLLHSWSAPGEPCAYECESGCSVYDRRPMSCRAYRCWWLRGWGPEEERPDRLGLIVDNAVSSIMLARVAPLPLCIVSETKPGVLAPKGSPVSRHPETVRTLIEERVVLLRWWGDMNPTEAIGPEPYMRRVRAVDEQWRSKQQ